MDCPGSHGERVTTDWWKQSANPSVRTPGPCSARKPSPWERQTRRGVKARAWEAALQGARLGTRARGKAPKGEAGGPT